MELDIDNSRLIVGKKILDTRNEAKEIAEFIAEKITYNKKINLDFSSVDFISRSFADELYVQINKLKLHGYSISLINLSNVNSELFKKIESTYKNKTTNTSTNVYNTSVTFKSFKDYNEFNIFINTLSY